MTRFSLGATLSLFCFHKSAKCTIVPGVLSVFDKRDCEILANQISARRRSRLLYCVDDVGCWIPQQLVLSLSLPSMYVLVLVLSHILNPPSAAAVAYRSMEAVSRRTFGRYSSRSPSADLLSLSQNRIPSRCVWRFTGIIFLPAKRLAFSAAVPKRQRPGEAGAEATFERHKVCVHVSRVAMMLHFQLPPQELFCGVNRNRFPCSVLLGPQNGLPSSPAKVRQISVSYP